MNAGPPQTSRQSTLEAAAGRRIPRRAKVADWIRRYGLAECAGLVGAQLGSLIARVSTQNLAAAAYGATFGESACYYLVIIVREILAERRRSTGSLTMRDVGRVSLRLLTEFGPAEVLDVLLIRPAAMAAGIHLLGPRLGVVAGQIAANVCFYVPVIFVYERRKRRS